jgi:hypothetical protein
VKGIIKNSIKRPNLRIMGIEEGEEEKDKGIRNIFNKIITENFSNFKKVLLIHAQEASRIPNSLDLPTAYYLSLKQQAQREEKEY